MKKENANALHKKNKKLIELILSCNDCIYTTDELIRMDENRLKEVRNSMLFNLRGKINKADSNLFIQENSILGMVNDLFLTR